MTLDESIALYIEQVQEAEIRAAEKTLQALMDEHGVSPTLEAIDAAWIEKEAK